MANAPTAVPAASALSEADIVVRRLDRQGKTLYVLGRAHGPGQYYVCSCATAIAQAVTFANLTCVHAWFAEDGGPRRLDS